MMKEKRKQQCDLSSILPNKQKLGEVFWLIIVNCPIGHYLFLLLMIFEEFLKVLLTSRLSFEMDFFEQFLHNLRWNNQQIPQLFITLSIVLIGFHFSIIFMIWYTYKHISQISDSKNITITVQVITKVLSAYFMCANTFLNLIIHTYIIQALFLIFGTAHSEQGSFYAKENDQIINLVLIVILTIVLMVFELVINSFFNLNFINEILVASKPAMQKFEYFKLAQHSILIALSLQTELSYSNKVISLIAIILLAGMQLFRCTYFISYFDPKMDKFNLILKIFKTSFFISQLITVLMELNYKNFIVIYVIVLPTVAGIALTLRVTFIRQMFTKFYRGDLKREVEMEKILYIILEQLQSDNILEHQKFLGLIIQYEEGEIDEEAASYLNMIKQILKLRNDQRQYQEEEFITLLEKNNLVQKEQLEEKFDDGVSMDQEAIMDSFLPSNMPTVDISMLKNFSHNQDLLTNQNDIQQSRNFIKSRSNASGIFKLIGNSFEPSQSSLFELFSIDQLQKKRIKDENKHESLKVTIQGQIVDLSNLEEAVMTQKILFLIEIILRQASIQFPDSLAIMYYKAYVCMKLLNNKYLTLTTITHCHTNMTNSGYNKQVENYISHNYFLDYITQKSQNQQNENEHDTDDLLNQSLKIDEVLQLIKQCTKKISNFWQIVASENISRDQMEDLLSVSTVISQMLRKIKTNLHGMTKVENFQSTCQSLYYYLTNFYTIVLRDQNQGQIILKHMLNMRSLGMQSILKNNQIDETGLVIVDGNFTLYGKILFTNKTILKLLNYKPEDVEDKKIHILMPSQIAEIHNKLWSRFAEVGVSKILDQTRYLYVKDKQGYIYPYKIFIKFMYHHEFGYSFIGIFRKPKNVTFDESEPAVRTRKTNFMICDEQGKILEISKSVNVMMKLNPQLLDNINQAGQEKFTLSHLNPQLQLNLLDFSKNNCYYYRYLTLNFQNVLNFLQDSEFSYELDSLKDVFKNRHTFKAQMKIIKETYGSKNNAEVSLYYVIFAEQSQQNTLPTISSAAAGQGVMNSQLARQTILSINNYDSFSDGESDNIYFNDKEDQNMISAIHGKSISTESLMGPGSSISSSYSSSQTSNALNEIRFMEEGIEYQKNPKPLTYLRVSLIVMLFMSLTLSCIQFGLNVSNNQQNINYQRMMAKTLQTEETLTSLELLCRIYLNINLGLEPNNYSHFTDRKQLIREISQEMIEKARFDMKELQQFTIQIQDQQSYKDHFSQSAVTLYELFSNQTIGSRDLSRFYSLNDWLVKISDIFTNQSSNSSISTYLFNQSKTSGQLKSQDQSVFFVLINAKSDLLEKYKSFNQNCENFINFSVESTNQINKIYVIITAIAVIILTLITVYYMVFVNQFKFRVLDFFGELDKQTIIINEQCALEFQYFLKTDDFGIIKKKHEELNQFEIEKTQNQLKEIQGRSGMTYQNYKIGNKNINSEAKDPQNKINSKKMLQGIVRSKLTDKLKKQYKKEDGNESLDDESDSESYENPKNAKFPQEESKVQGPSSEIDRKKQLLKRVIFNMNGKQADDGNANQKPSISELSQSQIAAQNKEKMRIVRKQLKDLSESKEEQDSPSSISEPQIQNKMIISRLKELKMKKLTQQLIIGICISFIIIVYFVVQYLVFENNQIQLKSNTGVIRKIQSSLECSNTFLYNVRDLIVSNSTQFQLQKSLLPYPLQIVQSTDKLSSLNQTYQECIKINQYSDNWLLKNLDDYFIGESGIDICSYLEINNLLKSQQSIDGCRMIYQGILKKGILQQTSLFIQDALYQAIRFEAQLNKNEAFIKSQLNNQNSLELQDSINFYQQYALRNYFAKVFSNLLDQKSSQNILLAIFIVFLVSLILSIFIINFYVIPYIRNNFWNAFYVLKLLPKDEISQDFIKRINEFLRQA
eukprot:403333800